jgi:hypothetical protein
MRDGWPHFLSIESPNRSALTGTDGLCMQHAFIKEALVYIVTEVEVTLRPTVSQLVCLCVEPTLGLVTRFYFLSEGCCLKVVVLFLCGAPFDERMGLQFSVQSPSVPSRAEPATILYCLIWDSLEDNYTPGHWAPVTSPLTTCRATVKAF